VGICGKFGSCCDGKKFMKEKLDVYLRVQDSVNAAEGRYATTLAVLAGATGAIAAFEKLGISIR